MKAGPRRVCVNGIEIEEEKKENVASDFQEVGRQRRISAVDKCAWAAKQETLHTGLLLDRR